MVPGSRRSPGEGSGYPLLYSWLENSMDRGAWQAIVDGVRKSDMTEWLTHMHAYTRTHTRTHTHTQVIGNKTLLRSRLMKYEDSVTKILKLGLYSMRKTLKDLGFCGRRNFFSFVSLFPPFVSLFFLCFTCCSNNLQLRRRHLLTEKLYLGS